MNRYWLGCFSLIVVLTAAPVRAAELATADAVLDFAAAKNAGYESYSAAFVQSMNMPAIPDQHIPAFNKQLTGTIWFKRPAAMRMELASLPQRMVMVIGPDQIMWQEVIMGGQTNVMKMDLQSVPSNHPAAVMLKDSFKGMDPQAQLARAKERYAFTLLPATVLHSQPMYVLAGEIRPGATLTAQELAVVNYMGQLKLFIGQQDGFMHRFENLDKAGSNTVLQMEFTDFHFNTPLADKLFVYQPAPNANVIDFAQMLLQMLNRPATPPTPGH